MIDAFDMVKDDPELEAMVVVGEIGGDSEEILAQHIIDTGFKKPIVGYIAGRQAPKEKRMGTCRRHSHGKLWFCRIKNIHVCKGKHSGCKETR